MKKYGLALALAILTIFSMTSCRAANEMANDIRYEITDGMRVDYQIGDNLDNIKFNNGRLRQTNKKGNYVDYDYNHSMYNGIDYDRGYVNFRHEGRKFRHRLDRVEGLNYINNSRELKRLENKSGIYFIKGGNYEIDSLEFNEDIALIGLGKVNIRVNNYNDNKPFTFNGHATLTNVNLEIEGYDISNNNLNNLVSRTNMEHRFFGNNVLVNGNKLII